MTECVTCKKLFAGSWTGDCQTCEAEALARFIANGGSEPAKPGSLERVVSPHKGDLRGECNRTECNRTPAMWWNQSTHKYYCALCALRINDWNPGLCFEVRANDPSSATGTRDAGQTKTL